MLKAYELENISFGKPYKSSLGKVWGLLQFNFSMLRTLLQFRPDISLGHSSMYAAQMSWLLGIPHLSVEDTGNMEQVRLYKPFAKAILVPESFHRELGNKMIRYAGNHELAYLHPNQFTPDEVYQLPENSSFKFHHPSPVTRHHSPVTCHPFIILRFVAWHASHDKGHNGISIENKRKAFKEFSKFGQVFISAEGSLPEDLEPYRLSIPQEKFHDVLASASLVYGESATVASEACCLGVPAIYLDNTGRCYTQEEEEKYGLIFNFTESAEDQERSIQKGIELLSTPGIREEWQKRRDRMLDDKIDITAFLVWFVENWPESMKIMQENPNYQYRFKSTGTSTPEYTS